MVYLAIHRSSTLGFCFNGWRPYHQEGNKDQHEYFELHSYGYDAPPLWSEGLRTAQGNHGYLLNVSLPMDLQTNVETR
jgi:hypothetical protein